MPVMTAYRALLEVHDVNARVCISKCFYVRAEERTVWSSKQTSWQLVVQSILAFMNVIAARCGNAPMTVAKVNVGIWSEKRKYIKMLTKCRRSLLRQD